MANLEHSRPQRREGDPDLPPDLPVPTGSTAQVSDSDLDSMLEEIDEVLEINAEEFVRSFVQKGGQ